MENRLDGGRGGLDPETAIPPAAREAILDWYDARGRSLPFRGTRDPYAILVSEVMAQQTQIDRVGPKWSEFLATFPSVRALAAASLADVLRAWAGLGYNRRALNLWRAARVIVERHDGRLPDDVDALAELPGIGPYTARAVAAIAFGRAVGAIDTNVRRVVGRVAGAIGHDLQDLADAIVPANRPADWTHAVMDVGATFCRSTSPRCPECPVRTWCRHAAAPDGRPGGSGARVPGRRSGGGPFHRTSRWLRGRILERARLAEGWTAFDGSIGDHDLDAVRAALDAMAAEGLVELDSIGAGPVRARLPLS